MQVHLVLLISFQGCFLIILQVLGTSVIKLGFVLVLNVENSQRLHQVGVKKCQEEWKKRRQCRRQEATEFSLCIAKISQGLRKFRNHSENFATIAKISQSLRNFHYAHFFAMIAKFGYHSENLLS